MRKLKSAERRSILAAAAAKVQVLASSETPDEHRRTIHLAALEMAVDIGARGDETVELASQDPS